MGIPVMTCSDHFNQLMKNSTEWNEEMDQKFVKSYQSRRAEIWKGIAKDLGIPWRAVEDRAYDLGKKKLARK